MRTRYQPGSPSTSSTMILASRSGRRARTSGDGLSSSTTYCDSQLLSSRSRPLRSLALPICSRWSTLM